MEDRIIALEAEVVALKDIIEELIGRIDILEGEDVLDGEEVECCDKDFEEEFADEEDIEEEYEDAEEE